MNNILGIIRKYNYDLYRGNLSMEEYLSSYFSKYLEDLSTYIDESNEEFREKVGKKINLIQQICNEIIDIIHINSNGFTKKSYSKSYELFYKIEPYLLNKKVGQTHGYSFFRIRRGDFSDSNKRELFHISKDNRHLIGAFRYSIPGIPCLYLAKGIELAWLECGMPQEFSYCKMEIDRNLNLINFIKNPHDFSVSVICGVQSGNKNINDSVCEDLLNYIVTYPLMAACSMKVKNRGNKFVEEYVIPQMLMEWVRESKYFDGIAYKSSLYNNLAKSIYATNIVLPVKEFREDGLCKNLTSKISISDIAYFDVKSHFDKCKKTISEIKDFKNKLEYDVGQSTFKIKEKNEMIEVCEVVIRTYETLIDGGYNDTELIFSYIEIISRYISMIYKNTDNIEKENNDLKSKDLISDYKCILDELVEFKDLMDKIIFEGSVFSFDFKEENLINCNKI